MAQIADRVGVMAFAWFSLVWVAFTDFYIYLVSSGAIRDLNTWS